MSGNIETTKIKFEFGRHATFHLREGWLAKGMSIATEPNGFDPSLETADQLGLGSKMIISLAFWMEAMNLIERKPSNSGGKKQKRVISKFGLRVNELDPYFEFPMTLWISHIILANKLGTIWNWFYNYFNLHTFDREICTEYFIRHLHEKATNPPALNTCKREVNCLLALYNRPSIGVKVDPEDITISPLRSLGLLVRNLDSGNYEKTSPIDKIPVEAFLAAISSTRENEEYATIRLTELVTGLNSPGRLMNLTSDSINELAEQAAGEYSKLEGSGVKISLLGSDRVLSMPIRNSEYWLDLHFKKNIGMK